jgi:hypothetical protein
MKRFILILIFTIVIITSASSQWYKWRYGVDSLNVLTRSQLEESLKRETSLKTKDIVGVTAGTAAITTGLIMIKSSGSDSDIGKAIGKGIFASSLVVGGIVILPTEIILILIRNARIKQIKEVLNISDVKLGILNCPVNYITRANNSHPFIGVTVTFTF